MNVRQNRGTILVGEDEPEVRAYLEMGLKYLGYSVEMAQDGEEVLECLRSPETPISAVLLDIMMPQRDGLDTLKEIRRLDSGLPVIMISGAASTLNVVAAMKSGATDFLCKPVEHEELQAALSKALAAVAPGEYAPSTPSSCAPAHASAFAGRSRRVVELRSLVTALASSEAPVLIQGETGTGKEVFARELHANSPRTGKIFLKLNCAALPSELVESELFGYERGAFTGAFQKRLGMFELANGGTLLLDEIGDMDVRLQAKLLQVLQDQEFQRIGGREMIRVNVRIMAATHRELEQAIADRTFREDLYYRLNVLNVHLPALRDRRDDILPLAEHLLERHAVPGRPTPAITPELAQAMTAYHWPGNVRELENAVRKLLVLRDPGMLIRELQARTSRKPALVTTPPATVPDALPQPQQPRQGAILEEVTRAKERAEAQAILAALDRTRWNRKQAALLLQIDYKALLYKMKKLGLDDKPSPAATQTDNPRTIARAAGSSAGGQ
jgi:two-component system response regulator AtoC